MIFHSFINSFIYSPVLIEAQFMAKSLTSSAYGQQEAKAGVQKSLGQGRSDHCLQRSAESQVT